MRVLAGTIDIGERERGVLEAAHLANVERADEVTRLILSHLEVR